MTAQRRSWKVPNLCAKKRSSGRLAASGPSHPWTTSLMYVLEVKDLLRPVRNSSHEEFEWNQRRASCKEIFGKLQVMDEWLRMPLGVCKSRERTNPSFLC